MAKKKYNDRQKLAKKNWEDFGTGAVWGLGADVCKVQTHWTAERNEAFSALESNILLRRLVLLWCVLWVCTPIESKQQTRRTLSSLHIVAVADLNIGNCHDDEPYIFWINTFLCARSFFRKPPRRHAIVWIAGRVFYQFWNSVERFVCA